MLKTTILSVLAALALGAGAALAQEEHEAARPRAPRTPTPAATSPTSAFSFEGPFGRFDQPQLQRGLQVYTEVCSACHGLQYLSYRELAEHGGVVDDRGADARLRGDAPRSPTPRPARPGRRRRPTTSRPRRSRPRPT